MREFFRGWRRKAGVVTLVMACALTGLWMRSQHMRDSLQVRIADNAAYICISNESELVWQSLSHEATEEVQLRRFAVSHIPVSQNRVHFGHGWRRTEKEDYGHSVSFKTIPGSRTEIDAQLAAWKLPHWCVVLPLTLLSAYLLLWTPRKRTEPHHA